MVKTTIVGFGDSLTYGYGVEDKITYTSRLAKYMPEYYPLVQWNIINSGINGDTSREALERLQKDVLNYNPNIVFFFFGSNDCALDEDHFRSMDEFENNLNKITTQILSHDNHSGLNHSRPVLMFITSPPMVETDFLPFTTNERLEIYNEKTKEIAKKYNCAVIDFYNYLQQESGGDIEAYTQYDGIHLNKAGYDCLYDCIFSTLSQVIDREGILINHTN